jgi:hypothetical protein
VRFEWEGGLEESSAKDLLELARSTGATLSDKELRFLGIAAFFAAFREHGHFAAAERALDALDPVLSDPDATASFQNGIADLKLHLFPRRSEHRHVLLDAALAFLRSRLGEL